jgi:glycerol-3-phosphate cytidylyltransferase
MKIIRALRCVDDVFCEKSLELRRHYIELYRAEIMVLNRKWEGQFDFLGQDACQVLYY